MKVSQTSTVERDPAEIYDELFVPALFAQWGPRVTEAAAVRPGQRVIDVGCGTGVLACAVADQVGQKGYVVGLDPNAKMLAVASRKPRNITWQLGRAEELPFDDFSFDVVVSQFALMFVESQSAAIAEMVRVLRPGGRLAVAVWDSLDQVPGYLALAELLGELFGDDVAGAMQAPFTLGNRGELLRLFAGAGASGAEVRTHPGTVFFASIEAMISTERACVWTLGGMLDEQQFARLRQRAQGTLQRFVGSDGSVQFDCPAHIVTWAKV
jgi:SAM-dependent methyltransferase